MPKKGIGEPIAKSNSEIQPVMFLHGWDAGNDTVDTQMVANITPLKKKN